MSVVLFLLVSLFVIISSNTALLGREFLTAPLLGRTAPNIFTIVSSDPSTVSTNHPVLLAQFVSGQECSIFATENFQRKLHKISDLHPP